MYTSTKQRHSLEWNVIDVFVLHAVTIRFGRRSKFRTFTEYMVKKKLKMELYFYAICFEIGNTFVQYLLLSTTVFCSKPRHNCSQCYFEDTGRALLV